MTPLAQKIVKQMMLPIKKRSFTDRGNLLPRMSDIHCFEVTDVFSVAGQIGHDLAKKATVPEVVGFLPAPKTWIEFQTEGGRTGFLMEENKAADFAVITWASMRNGIMMSMPETTKLLLSIDNWDGQFPQFSPGSYRSAGVGYEDAMDRNTAWLFMIYGLLAMINTPRIIGRRQHMPHRGLQRDLISAQGVVGRFPLHAWTEIVLRVSPPEDKSGDPSAEAHLTGKRALHFCRAHLRIRLGQLEIVRSHWRGDGSLGIKQSRYRLEGPQ